MQLLTAAQIREWDQFTIANEPVSSVQLMERAAASFCQWFSSQFIKSNSPVTIFCGNGNNGGDGLAIARMLRDHCLDVQVWILRVTEQDSPDFAVNLAKLMGYNDVPISFIHEHLPECHASSICIDALLGTGVSRPISGMLEKLVTRINETGFQELISVDMPSGLPSDSLLEGEAVKADIVFTFQLPKRSFFYQEHAPYCQRWVVGDIGLDPTYLATQKGSEHLADLATCSSFLQKRNPFSHKGTFGHAFLLAGSEGKLGAAILAGKAAMRSGCGWATLVVPDGAMNAVHASVNEVMCLAQENILSSTEQNEAIFSGERATVRTSWGCGPGLGTGNEALTCLKKVLSMAKSPVVLDADGLNLLAANPSLWQLIPENSILTPHPGEFARLFGETTNSIEIINLLKEKAINHNVVIVLKGRYTRITLPDGKMWINTTGNTGMASAGTGDVLTGIITSLLAQRYSSWQAAVLGVFLHGMAGDIALDQQSEESLNATDVIECIGKSFHKLHRFIADEGNY